MTRFTRRVVIFLPLLAVVLCSLSAAAPDVTQRISPQPKLVCLMYHRFTTPAKFAAMTSEERCYCVSTERFEAQLQWLKENRYQSIRLDDALEFARGDRRLPDHCVLITIDDGCHSILSHAAPLLRKYGFSAVVFLTTNSSAKVFHEVPGDRQLDVAELKSLDASLFEFGAHGVTHRPLTELTDTELRRELAEPRQILEAWTGHVVRALAVPHGRYDARVQEAVRRAGYDMMFTSDRGDIEPGMDLHALSRRNIAGTCNIRRFQFLMSQ